LEYYDVFGIGAISVDLIGKTGYWPGTGTKIQLEEFDIHDGGLTGTALVTVARLGGRAGIGARLGFSTWAERSVNAFEKAGVDVSNVIRVAGCEPVISMIITTEQDFDRNIFFSRKGVSYPMPGELPDQYWHRHTRVLLIDHGTGQAGVEAARIASKSGVQVVIDAERIEPHLEEMFDHCHHIVISHSFARMYSGLDSLEKALLYLRKTPDQHIIITRGQNGLIGLTGNEVFRISGHQVPVVDTTGCGDVFHGAYALAVARGNDVKEASGYANAAAAMSAMFSGGRQGIPSSDQLKKFIRENPR
jgi:sugar/nucleoside kinase (ribokinase family)